VKELAEVLAVDFDDAEGVPKLKPNWRWEDEEQALLTSCSSLITTVETGDSRVVQFSHFSVKEYLTSERLATSSGNVSRYHIDLKPAHTIMAQACMGILLQLDDRVEDKGVGKNSPLAEYAARHWATHAQFERVSSFIQKAMEYLFDPEKPYFAAWVQLYDIDTYPTGDLETPLYWFAVRTKSDVTPLYYAALCGFEELIEHLVVKYPQHVNTSSGHYLTPLIATLSRRHFRTAKLLYHNGVLVNVHGRNGETPLISAGFCGDLEMVQVLLDCKADVNATDNYSWTPMHNVAQGHSLPAKSDITRLLLERGADINARNNFGSTPLHVAAKNKRAGVTRVLLEHGANIGAKDNEGRTPSQVASQDGYEEFTKLLSEHGGKGVL
jgi:hypothetical protein